MTISNCEEINPLLTAIYIYTLLYHRKNIYNLHSSEEKKRKKAHREGYYRDGLGDTECLL